MVETFTKRHKTTKNELRRRTNSIILISAILDPNRTRKDHIADMIIKKRTKNRWSIQVSNNRGIKENNKMSNIKK